MDTQLSREVFYSRFGPNASKVDNQMFKPILGRVNVEVGSVTFFGPAGDIFIPTSSIKSIFLIFEHIPYYTFFAVYVLNFYILSRIFFFNQKIEIATVFSLMVALMLLVDFFYLTLKHKKRWIYLIYEADGEKQNAYFTCDWRGNFLALPWSRQDKLWMWLLRRREILVLYKVINIVTKK